MHLELKATSIIVAGRSGGVTAITLFQPDDPTWERARQLAPHTVITSITLYDNWDNGTVDTHTSHQPMKFRSLEVSFGKLHTLTLTFWE